MKQLIPDWLYGFELLARLLVMLFCIVSGPALLMATYLLLVSLGIRVPVPLVVMAQLLYFIVVCPCLLARYASDCGYRTEAVQSGLDN